MRGVAGRSTSGLPSMARIDCVDNTGAKVVQLITVLKKGGVARRYPAGGVGDMIRVTVRRGTPETRRQIFNAVIVRQRRPFRRVDGTWVQFEDNACVITNERGDRPLYTSNAADDPDGQAHEDRGLRDKQ